MGLTVARDSAEGGVTCDARVLLKKRENHMKELKLNPNRTQQMIDGAKERVKEKPNDSDRHNYLALMLGCAERMDEAMDELKIAIKLNPENHAPLCNMGIFLSRQGKSELAIEAYKKAIGTTAKPYGGDYHKLGLCFKAIGKYADAETALRQAAELSPEDEQIREDLNVVLVINHRRFPWVQLPGLIKLRRFIWRNWPRFRKFRSTFFGNPHK